MTRFPPTARLVTAITLSLGVCSAQIVSPPHFANAEGPTYLAGPIGQNSTTGWRHLQVHDDLTGPPRTFNFLSIRRDPVGTLPYNAFSAQVTLILSHAATTSATVDTTFQNNHGAGMKTVVNNRVINFPSTAAGGAPAGFVYTIPFEQPFNYSGSGSLCWELRTTSFSNYLTTYYFDAVTGASSSPALGIATYGFGCRHSSRQYPMAATGRSSMNWFGGAGTLYVDGSELPDGGPVTVLLGVSKTSLRGAPLPLLLPGSLTAPSGPCLLYTSAEFAIGAVSSNTSATLTLAVPATPSLHAVHLFAQYIAIDPRAGHLTNVTLSNGVEYCFVAPFAAALTGSVYATNLFATTGTVQTSYGYVVQLR